MALRWQGAGAKRLHLVDIDGADAGELCNAPVIEEIARRIQIPENRVEWNHCLSSMKKV